MPRLLADAEAGIEPAWRRLTNGEARWPASAAVVVAIALQFLLPAHVRVGARWLLPLTETLLLVVLSVLNPGRITRYAPRIRVVGLLLIGAMTTANIWSAARLIHSLVRVTAKVHGVTSDPVGLLTTGASIWLTNVVVFSLWYWEFDRGGPGARAEARHTTPDLVFPQMTSPRLAAPDWEPGFVDYLYVSFTNATAFSPTDTLPFTRWAKLTMMAQSAVSLITVGLVIARAVNILQA